MEIRITGKEIKQGLSNAKLDELVYRMEECNSNLIRKAKISENISPDVINKFVGSYYSINEKLDQEKAFSNDLDPGKIRRACAAFYAANIILSDLKSKEIEKKYQKEAETLFESIQLESGDLDHFGHRPMMSSVLTKLEAKIKSTLPSSLDIELFTFFDYYKSLAKQKITRASNEVQQEFNEITLKCNSQVIQDVFFQKGQKRVKETVGNEKEDGLALYITNPKAEIKKVVGNKEAIKILREDLAKLLAYDTKAKKNPFEGEFIDTRLVYGDRGVGKNFTVDALINNATKIGEECGKEVVAVDFRAVRSTFTDGKAEKFQQYMSIIKKNTDKIYVIVVDEADGILARESDGSAHSEDRKLYSEFKANLGDGRGMGRIYTILISNYSDDKSIESALRQRFPPLKMDGPTTPEEYARILFNEMETPRNLGRCDNIDWDALGKIVYSYRSIRKPPTGRDCNLIAKSLNGGMKLTAEEQEEYLPKMSYEECMRIKAKMYNPLTQDDFEVAIFNYFKSESEADSFDLNDPTKKGDLPYDASAHIGVHANSA